MASIIKNSLSHREHTKQGKTLEIEQEIEQVEESIRRLKIDFDIYFNGGRKIAPNRERASLEARINRINGNRDLSFAARYKLNNLMSRYNSYRELWRRKLKVKGDEIY
ncbi:MAG: hypothetical protein ACR2MD_01360 [Aridibacter sp.]|jgi:hypothetical protein|nr:hypothetical protein [Acidobacteriota bacterium]